MIQHLPEFECQALEYPFQIPTDSIVVGYGMGGRIALKCPQPKIILSAHPGLKTPQEKQQRWQDDQQWIEKLKTMPFEQFLREWYAQPLFETLDVSSVLERRLKQNPLELAEILSKESLSHQTFSVPSNAAFLHGQLDAKYKQLYRDLGISSIEIPNAGHAIHLENPLGLANAIRSYLE